MTAPKGADGGGQYRSVRYSCQMRLYGRSARAHESTGRKNLMFLIMLHNWYIE